MGVIKVPTTFNIDVEFDIADFGRRLLAWIIDCLIQFFYLRIAAWFMIETEFWVIGLFIYLPVFLYHVILEITMNGQSVGKKLMSIRIINESGGRPSISQFIIRWLLRDIWFLSLLAIGIGLAALEQRQAEGVFLILFSCGYFITDLILVVSSKKGQRLGDMLAHTIAIRTNSRTSIEETVFQEVADSYTPVFPQIMRLSDKDINAIKNILEMSKRRDDFDMAAAAAEKIKSHLKINSDMSPFDFLEVLLMDYNYLSVK